MLRDLAGWLLIVAVFFGLLHGIGMLVRRLNPDAWEAATQRSYFALDRALGLSSETFDLEENIRSSDNRHGLSVFGKFRVRWLMWRHRIPFDEARFMFVQESFAENEIGPDGMPKDPRALVFR